ncbi:MAG: HAD-IIB family hydrolase [Gammaproteobacteria bacterium]|jgi:sucrose-phosphate synthase
MSENKKPGLYLMLISIHGLIRGKDPELGRDADTGGQVLYLLELAKALGAHPDVARVDLLTRRVIDSKVSDDYAVEQEKLARNVHLVRIDCGPRRYLRKEVLWPHLEGFIDGTLKHIRQIGRTPDIIHGHYADAGLVSARLAGLFGVPMIFTGHSLGREKQKQLLKKGQRKERIDKQYNMSQRIEAEEISLGTAEVIIASTSQEVETQYATYDNYHPKRMHVVPPGVNISRFRPPKKSERKPAINRELARFLEKPDKPMILALSRADERKNIAALVKAYAESDTLKDKANLVIIAGNRDVINKMDKGSRTVLSNLLLQIDEYDLYGKVAFPKHHESDDVPALYRLAAMTKGVFVNPALTEPFGLTLIEAAASGLPVVATNDGGPNEIIRHCRNGFLVDPHSPKDIAAGLEKVIASKKTQWNKWSRSGYQGAHNHYSWSGHAECYLSIVKNIVAKRQQSYLDQTPTSRLVTADRIGFTSLDNALFGNKKSLAEFMDYIRETPENIAMGIATGRTLESALALIRRYKTPLPNIFITSVGTEIHYKRKDGKLIEDKHWRKQLDYRWEPAELKKLLKTLPGIKVQKKSMQTEFKISYLRNPETGPRVAEIKQLFRQHDLHAKVIIADEKHLDILPIRASKGLAIRYLSLRWGIPLDRILVVGDSGNDEEMLLGDTLAVVVGNHSPELDKLRDKPRIYFAKSKYANSLIEGIEYYNFIKRIRIPNDYS